jgi:hypothetical protein
MRYAVTILLGHNVNMAHNFIQIARLIKQSIRTGKYERMLEEDPKPAEQNPFLDDEAVDENPIPTRERMEKQPKQKIVDGKIYELKIVPGCKRLKKWYPAGQDSAES